MKICLIFIASRNPQHLVSRIEICGTPAQSSLKHIKPGLSRKNWWKPKHAFWCKIAAGGEVLRFYEKFHVTAIFISTANRRYLNKLQHEKINIAKNESEQYSHVLVRQAKQFVKSITECSTNKCTFLLNHKMLQCLFKIYFFSLLLHVSVPFGPSSGSTWSSLTKVTHLKSLIGWYS